MARIRMTIGGVALDAELLDTPTANAIAAALPLSASALTWGEEVYFNIPVAVARDLAPAPKSVVRHLSVTTRRCLTNVARR